jgi:hypothetical protein
MRLVPRVALLVISVALPACGDPAARVQLAPVSPCGQVTNETALRIVAYTAGGEQRRTVPPTQIDAFPADTEQLGAEVIGDNGRIVAAGKTAPLAFDGLPDGTSIPIVMAPLEGSCPVGPLTEPRAAPAVARAGELVLVVGGIGPGGERLSTAEVYDPTTTTFTPIDVPPSLQDPDNGLAGAVLSELPDGRVAMSGTASHALAIFDPATRKFSAPVLFDHRAFHGALGVAEDRLLVIGGCADVTMGACSGPSLRTGFVYDLTDVTMRERGPALDPTAMRHGARVFDLGEQRDGSRRFVLAGGSGELGAGDRFALTDAQAERLTGLHPQATVIDGGALLTVDSATTSMLAPDAQSALDLSDSPPTGASIITLEDGRVLGVGAELATFRPTSQTWTTLPSTLPPLTTPTLVRLADGSVLIVGGAATTDAFVFRPSLVGPNTGSLVVVSGDDSDGILTVPTADPALVERTGSMVTLIAAGDDLSARVIVGGPRMAQGSISAVVRATGGGVALLAQQTGPGHVLVGRLVPGEVARIYQRQGGMDQVLCTGQPVSEAELMAPVTLSISDSIASLSVGAPGSAIVKATCEVPTADRGTWGLGAAGEGARVEVGPVTVARTR